jgi:hypothetical protein
MGAVSSVDDGISSTALAIGPADVTGHTLHETLSYLRLRR